jgi:alpha-L-fucosidase
MRKLSTFLFTALFFSMLVPIQKINAQYTIPSKMEWWYGARFGMFIHFGSYSYLGHGEWAYFTDTNPVWTKATYQAQVSANFNPVNFNAGTIARLAAKAGMKYLVITAKHHEGFCMWQTAVQGFKDVTGTKLFDLPDFTNFTTRDILQELKDSCDALGVKFCLYYSIMDWSHSSQNVNRKTYYSTMVSDSARTSYITDMKAQLSELITKYHPAVLWFDGDWTYNSGSPTLDSWWTEADGVDLYNYVTGLDSNLVVNERVCRGFGLGDFECPENTIPLEPKDRQWETCRTMNNSWGYNSSDASYKTADSLIHELTRTVSRDGNYLLNIGPKGDGTVTSQSTSILNSFGDWMGIYSESIYGTSRSPYSSEPKWGVYTRKTGKLYAHVFKWPTNGLLTIPSLTNSINKIYLLNDTATLLNHTDSSGYLKISVPTSAPNSVNSVVVIDVTGLPEASSSTDANQEIKDEYHVSLFPNPAEGILNIKQTGNLTLDIAVYNILGQNVLNQKVYGMTAALDVSGLSPGIYTIKISDGERVSTEKFIKK